jgi:hypothetical protein
MNEGTLLTVLAFFFSSNESHFFEDFVEEHILYFGLRAWRNTQMLNYSKILFNKFLSDVFLVIQVYLPFLFSRP